MITSHRAKIITVRAGHVTNYSHPEIKGEMITTFFILNKYLFFPLILTEKVIYLHDTNIKFGK